MKFNKICTLGLGYIGLPTASTFASHGMKVIGVDINPRVVESLQKGQVHIQEPGLGTLVEAAINSGNLVIRSKPEPADAFIIAVPTPFLENKCADMRAVISATESILPHLKKGNLVVLESTSPPRTTVDLVAPILERSGLKAGVDFYLTYSPERVLPGQILRELIENARVIGGVNEASAQAGCDLYTVFVQGEIRMTDATTAEMVKLMENTSRDVDIAIANEFSHLAERFGVDIWEAIRLANLHPRINILNPGPGVGGHCISVDPWFLVEADPEETPLIRTARQVNDSQPCYVVRRLQRLMGEDLANHRITVLGLSYKANVDDLRESPAIEICHLLQKAGAQVCAFEPNKPDADLPGLKTYPTLQQAVAQAEAVMFIVGHREFCRLDPLEFSHLTPARILVDAVNLLPWQSWQQAGFEVLRIGDGRTH
jgi:UDP-N-acetyl-D-mannosaminuronic acid dehydrogenase